MYSTCTIYTRKEYMKFAKSILILRFKKVLPLLYFLFSAVLFFVRGDMSFVGALCALIFCFLALLASSVFIIPMCFLMFKRNWNTDKMMHNLRVDMVFNENDLNISSSDGQSIINYDSIYKIIETKTHFYIMLSAVKGHIVVKDNCSKELIDFIRKIKK